MSSSVADALRRDTVARVLALPVGERIALCLSLGDEDLARYASHAGIDPVRARLHLQAQHARGRRPSRAAGFDADDVAGPSR
jgi:hypothetical protein